MGSLSALETKSASSSATSAKAAAQTEKGSILGYVVHLVMSYFTTSFDSI